MHLARHAFLISRLRRKSYGKSITVSQNTRYRISYLAPYILFFVWTPILRKKYFKEKNILYLGQDSTLSD